MDLNTEISFYTVKLGRGYLRLFHKAHRLRSLAFCGAGGVGNREIAEALLVKLGRSKGGPGLWEGIPTWSPEKRVSQVLLAEPRLDFNMKLVHQMVGGKSIKAKPKALVFP